MFKSMTAYGRAVHSAPLGRFVAEIQSVNRKHLEVNTFLPPVLLKFDAEIKRWVAEQVGRGQVNLKISASFDQFSPLSVLPNLPLLRQYHQAWAAMRHELKNEGGEEAFWSLLDAKEIFIHEQQEVDEEQCRRLLRAVVSEALVHLTQMKEREGKLLYEDISARFARLPALIQQIAVKAPGAAARFRQRLMDRISELMGASTETDERILREVGLYAEKIDIEEELTRLDAHLKQVEELMHRRSGAVGKVLEFLLQEMGREVNTLSSKAADVDVSQYAIEIKSELEKIREQIQNIE
jgi:uncharacterized protein (TIGR00255 family)